MQVVEASGAGGCVLAEPNGPVRFRSGTDIAARPHHAWCYLLRLVPSEALSGCEDTWRIFNQGSLEWDLRSEISGAARAKPALLSDAIGKDAIASAVSTGTKRWDELFPGVATVTLTAHCHGPSIDPRTSKTGVPIRVVPEPRGLEPIRSEQRQPCLGRTVVFKN